MEDKEGKIKTDTFQTLSRMALNCTELKYPIISPSPLDISLLVCGACALMKRPTKAWYPVASKLCTLAENRDPKNELD
jgi:hypothetical protein